MLNKRWLGSLTLSLISLAIIGAFISYLFINADRFRQLLRLSAVGIVLLVVISLVLPIFNGMINTYMFRSLGVDLSQSEGFLLAAVSTLANQLPVSGGIVTRAVYLKRKYDFSYTKNLSSTLALFFCTIAIYGFLGLLILLDWHLFFGTFVSPILFVGFGLMASALLLLWLPMDRIPIPKFVHRWVTQALEGWLLISKNPGLVVRLLTLQTITMLLLAARYWLAFHMLSQHVTASQVILFASASVLTQLVSFAPGGLGVREAIVGGIAAALGFDPGTSVIAIGLDRLVATVVIVIVGWMSAVILGRQITQNLSDHEKQ